MSSVDFSALDRIVPIEEKVDFLLKLHNDENYGGLPEWIDLRLAAKLKNIPLSTLRNRPRLQPDKSKAHKIGGRRQWHRDYILEEWLQMDDNDLGYIPEQKTIENQGFRMIG